VGYLKLLRVLAAISLLLAVGWVITKPGFDSAGAVAGALTLLISTHVAIPRENRASGQQQVIAQSSVGIQAGGDVNIGNASGDKDAR
jgi:hypothetical protein